ncbi:MULTISPECIES: hypothetical protein [Pseudomonas syringae group]|uniref:Uncharacterized protein n=1 Tax=Pseudomonas amygdali pv. tabaci TaxID=322 RepID=A0AAX1VKZ0_PSEAJ|nr:MULTISPECIES: hypothetical protein [Pseudomonas syringae group]QOI06673.1 hypothetical protein D5S10_24230 [Pseudomonas savastanoi]KEZ25369.1 hypothetical protein A3SK_0121410 [Pseudomonas amygdali pv. tabaci str. 6605]KIY17943.1 hypothetical protein RD00_12715 [Pseudomonas amygdali pv. tabaci]KPY79884.1 Unknown protein sequence [Pseudomonas amygdali pv. tabaci]MDU8604798.1 hypothetical protein [Pseudomonas syringae group sp. 247E2]
MHEVITASLKSMARATFSSWPEKLADRMDGYGYLSVRRYKIAVTVPLVGLVMVSSAAYASIQSLAFFTSAFFVFGIG